MSDYAKTKRASEHTCRHFRRAERRSDAALRASLRARRTPAQQLAFLDRRPGGSLKERARLAGGAA